MKISAAALIVDGSLAETPKNRLWTHRVATMVAALPARPIATGAIDSRNTMNTTWLRAAPSALRTPISEVRRATR